MKKQDSGCGVRIQSLANFYIAHLFVYCQLYWKDEKKKEAGNGPFKKDWNSDKLARSLFLFEQFSFLKRANVWLVQSFGQTSFFLSINFSFPVHLIHEIWTFIFLNWNKYLSATHSVWPDWATYWTLGNFSKPLAPIILPKSTILR